MRDAATTEPLIAVRDLRTQFITDSGLVRAVDGVSFDIPLGKILCLVGESGCGKSITARSLLQILGSNGRIVSGSATFLGDGAPVDLLALDPRGRQIRDIRGRQISMIFQEPMTALSPVHTIGDQIGEVIRLHFGVGHREARDRTIEILERVGFPGAMRRLDSYSFQLSGGLRQRVCIAMALACGPRLLIADEPTTALDVTTQAGILDLLQGLQRETGMSVLFITHDLGVVAEIADEVAVMYLGTIAEQAGVDAIFHDPRHPYTQALHRSVPRLGSGGKGRRLEAIKGIVPHPQNRPPGCPYHTRCTKVIEGVCDRIVPPIEHLSGADVRCLLYSDLTGLGAEPAVVS